MIKRIALLTIFVASPGSAQVGTDITRSQIPLKTMNAEAFTVAGFSIVDDPGIGCVYVKTPTSGPSFLMPIQDASGAWFQLSRGRRNFELGCFGWDGSSTTLADAAVTNGIAAASEAGYPLGGVGGRLHAAPGYVIRTSANFALPTPVAIDFESMIWDFGTTGDAFTYGTGNQWSANYRIKMAGAISGVGNTTTPTSINFSGRTLHRLNSMYFSYADWGNIQGFSKYGIDCYGLPDPNPMQTVFHNTFESSQLAYNGMGIRLISDDAARSNCEVNVWRVSPYSNLINIQLDDPNHNASTSNYFFIRSMDDSGLNSHGGHGILNYSHFNWFDFAYLGGSSTNGDIYWAGNSSSNTYNVHNPASTGPVLNNGSTGQGNVWNIVK